jgi:hypothetical protein
LCPQISAKQILLTFQKTNELFDLELCVLEFRFRHGIKIYVKNDKGPLKESVSGIGCTKIFQQVKNTMEKKDGPPGILWTLCWMKKYTRGMIVAKNLLPFNKESYSIVH